jgi:hypothetical protein
MEHNLIIYDITFVEQYNVNYIINVFDGYGLKCHYFQYVCRWIKITLSFKL